LFFLVFLTKSSGVDQTHRGSDSWNAVMVGATGMIGKIPRYANGKISGENFESDLILACEKLDISRVQLQFATIKMK